MLVTGTTAAYDDECVGVLASKVDAYMAAVVVATDADNTDPGSCTAEVEAANDDDDDNDKFDMMFCGWM